MKPNRECVVTFTAREKAELLPADPPAGPVGAGQIAGRTLATVISAGTELNAGYLGEHFPRKSGYAAVFAVEEVGAEVLGFQPGNVAFCMGNHQSFQRVDARQALRVPEDLAPEKAVFARMMGVSMTTLVTTKARPPARVLVCGLGLVGHLAAKNFLGCGFEVVACDPVAARREVALETGIHNVLESAPADKDDLAGSFHLALECSGHEQALLDAARAVRKGGEVVCIATPWRPFTELSLHALHWVIFHNYVTIRSGWEWELPHQPEDFRPGSIFENFTGALRWLREGRVSVDGIYTVYSPERCQDAYQDLLHKRTERLAVVFDWTRL